MSTELIFTDNPGGIPATYVRGPSDEFRLSSVLARIDGSGASGPFVPCLSVYSQDGKLMARVPTDQTLAVGDTCVATWAPFLRSSGASGPPGPPGGTDQPIAALFNDPGSGTNIPADSVPHYIDIQDGVSSAGFSTTDGTVFTNGSSTLFTGSPVHGIQIQSVGTYLVLNNSFGLGGGTAGHRVTAYWAASNGSAPSFFQQGRSEADALDTWDEGQPGVGPHLFTSEFMTVSGGQTPATLVRFAEVQGGTDVSIAFHMMVIRISTSVLTKL